MRQASRPSTSCISQLLGDLEGGVKIHAFPDHLGEHKVRGTIHDTLYLRDNIGGQTLVHGGDDGGAAAHRCLKQKSTSMRAGQTQQLCTIGGHHLFVGGRHTAAAFQAGFYIGIGEPGAANGLHHRPDFRVCQDHIDIFDKEVGIRTVRVVLYIQDILDLYRLPCPAGDACRIAPQYLIHAAAHRAKAQNCDFSHTLSLSTL